MSSVQEKMFDEAILAIDSGERARARDLLTRLLKTGQDNAEYWIWMSAVVDSPKERSFCLKEALRLDPQNVVARRGLAVLGILPPDTKLVLPPRYHKRNWQKRLFPNEGPDQAAVPQRFQFVVMGVVLAVLLSIAGLAFLGSQLKWGRRTINVSQYMPTNTTTPVLAVTPTATAAISGSPTPLWMLLQATYTPTPLYVNTPHPASEAYRIGIRAYQNGEIEKALMYLQQAEKETSGSVDILYHLGEVYRLQENEAGAIEIYTRVIQQVPDFAPAYLGRARAKRSSNPDSLAEPLDDLKSALEKDPNLKEAYLELAMIQSEGKDPEQALETLDQLLLLEPDSALVYLYRARVYMETGDVQQALKYARQANQMDITLLPAYRLVGEALQEAGDVDESLDPLSTYVLYETGDAGAWQMLAKAYLADQNDEKALAALERALKLDSRDEEALLTRAKIFLATGIVEKALKDFRSVLEMNEESFEASLGVGQALIEMKYPGDAWKQFEATRPLAKDDKQKAEVLIWRAKSLELLDQKEAAIRDWKSLLEMPEQSIDSDWAVLARQRIAVLVTKTPTSKPKTATFTPTRTSTRWPTQTATFIPTRTSTRWPTQTPTPTITRKPTLTKTPIPSKTPVPTRKP